MNGAQGSHAGAAEQRVARSRMGLAVLAAGLLVVLSAASLGVVPVAAARQSTSLPGTRYAQIKSACPPAILGGDTCFALVRVPVPSEDAADVGVRPYTLDDGASESGPAGGLTPAQLASAYDYSPTEGGAGQTVAIVDVFDDPNIEADLIEFDKNYKLPECTTANGCLEKVGQTGSSTSLPAADTDGWSLEISLDVETVHSVCRACRILLVEADGESPQDLAAAVDEAVKLGATEVSNSYGRPEAGTGAAEEVAYNHPGVVIAASAGDEGYYDWDNIAGGREAPGVPNTPASLPSVVAVGGTSLHLDKGGTRESETVWNDSGRPSQKSELKQYAATGGGCSTLFTAPLWQQGTPGWTSTACGTKRLDNDIAAVGDPYTGFDVYDNYNCGSYCEREKFGEGWITIGGTSLSSPLITSLYALAGGSGRVPYPALTLYGHLGRTSAFYDVTEGGNGYCDGEATGACGEPATNDEYGDIDCLGTSACDAETGYDGPSGVGAPNGLEGFKPLFPTAVITPPGSPKSGVAESFGASASSDPYPGGSISSYAWNWGDGSSAGAGVSPTHTFAAPGAYTVTLTVTDNYGLSSAQGSQPVTVLEQTPEEKRQHEEEAAIPIHEAEAAAARAKREHEAAVAKSQEEEQARLKAGIAGVSGSSLPPAPVPDVQLASTALTASANGSVTVRVSCPAPAGSCTGTFTLRTLGAVSTSSPGARRKKAALTLVSASFTLAGGGVKTVTLHLSSAARKLLARERVLRARAMIVAHDPAGGSHTAQAIVTLRAYRAKHPRA